MTSPFLSKELAADRRTARVHLESLNADVLARSIGGETRKVVITFTNQSDRPVVNTDDLPAEQFMRVASRACAEGICGENKEPVADAAWWYDQPVDVLKECWGHVMRMSGLDPQAIDREKKDSGDNRMSGSSTALPAAAAAAIPTNCEPVLAAAS